MFRRFLSRKSWLPRAAGPAPRRSHGRRRFEQLEQRRVLSGLPLGAMPRDTAEFLLGRVAVTPVLVESTGAIDSNTQNWTGEEIQGVLQKVHQAMQWWVDTLESLQTVHSLEFVLDESFAQQPYQTPYEPIDRISDAYPMYVGGFLQQAGYGQSGTLEDAMRDFNHAQRVALDADWAFTIFVVDSSDDSDGQFAGGGTFGQAFAFAGGLFMITPSTRPASTIAHETGHLFWARDEYTGGGSWTDHRGYYDTQNSNAADNPAPGFVHADSIMSAGVPLANAFQQHVSPASTLAMVGWQDSDGDGIFDVADVPLRLTGSGAVDAATGRFVFQGEASAVALANRNPSGLQNDITLNRVSRIEYAIDGGPWLTAASPNLQTTAVSLSLPVPAGLQSIQLRAVDDNTGVVSPTITATPLQPAGADAAVAGFAFVDADQNGARSADEALLAGLSAHIVARDGGPPPQLRIDADQYASGPLPTDLAGVTLAAAGATVDGRVGVQHQNDAPVLAFYDLQTSQWRTAWSQQDVLQATLSVAATEVQIDAVGRHVGSVGRLEAYDDQGNLLARATSSPLAIGQIETLTVADPQGRIASVRAFGHARTTVALDQLRVGPQLAAQSDAFGVLRFENLPDGVYDVELTSRLAIHQVPAMMQITVAGGQAVPLRVAANRVTSPWRNPDEPADVDNNGLVQPLDALRVINELNRSGGGVLSDPSTVTAYFDTSDDGTVTALDALLVINILNRRSGAEAAAGEQQLASGGRSAAGTASDAAQQPASQQWVSSDVSPASLAAPPVRLPADPHPLSESPRWRPATAIDAVMAQWDSAAEGMAADAAAERPQAPLAADGTAAAGGLLASDQVGYGGVVASVNGGDGYAALVGDIPVATMVPFFPEPLAAEGF